MSKNKRQALNRYQIWVGFHHNPTIPSYLPTAPVKLATVPAISFEMACYKFELDSAMCNVLKVEKEGLQEDLAVRVWVYDAVANSNIIYGKYYPTEEQAWESFKTIGEGISA